MLYTRIGLERAGFAGWVPFEKLRYGSACPLTGGVYVVCRDPDALPSYTPASVGGWFKGKDPAVSLDALAANWVDLAEVVYIGKANNLRRRLKQYADFGAGQPVGHWGGRLIWQLADYSTLLVAWKETPDRVPEQVEAEMIADFRHCYGKPPFANDPHRLGA
ncbi:hypothetical protein NUH86_16780 [Sphingobium sp. JS3065]|uniref:hypothetical protein n=1 Tax=Sphingobium sp. JS3065 TaxID=2970925 RepID=UPI002263CFD5|nr:hypothetical protein [Sphingobium sp. JS3065]UZW55103.1 hypothetical protein NUH86_16780 [Sphingobium sp. JS3065]